MRVYRILIIFTSVIFISCTDNIVDKEWDYITKYIDSTQFDHFPLFDDYSKYFSYSEPVAKYKSGIFVCLAKRSNLDYEGGEPLKDNIDSYFIVDKDIIERSPKQIRCFTLSSNCSFQKPLPNFEKIKSIGYEISNIDLVKNSTLMYYECGSYSVIGEAFQSTVSVERNEWKHGYSRGSLYYEKDSLVIYWIDSW